MLRGLLARSARQRYMPAFMAPAAMALAPRASASQSRIDRERGAVLDRLAADAQENDIYLERSGQPTFTVSGP